MIHDLIAQVGERLTPTERRIAEAVLDDPTLLAFGTVSDLAERVDTSRPSVVRFATKLGFEGYTELQGWARDGVARQLATPSERIRQTPDHAASVRAGIEDSVGRAFDYLDPARLHAMAEPLAKARAVWIVSGETSRAGATVLHSGLSMVRDHVRLVEEHHLGRDLTSAAAGDAAAVFDFARYRRASVLCTEALVEAGVDVVAVTDGPLSPLVSMAKAWCELKIPAVGPFDSSMPAVLAAELIVHRVVGLLGPSVSERIDRLENLWRATRTFA